MGVLSMCCAVPVTKVSRASVAVKCSWIVLKHSVRSCCICRRRELNASWKYCIRIAISCCLSQSFGFYYRTLLDLVEETFAYVFLVGSTSTVSSRKLKKKNLLFY